MLCYVLCVVLYFVCYVLLLCTNMPCVMCYVVKTLGTMGLVTMNNRMTILGIGPKFGLSILRSNSKILAIN